MVIRRKLKRSTRQYLTVAVICIVVIGGAAIFTSHIITNQIKEEYEAQLSQAYQEMESNQRKVYVATMDIRAGDFISEDNIEERVVYASQPADTYLKESKEGKVALVDIPAGTQIINTMLTENQVSSELREVEFDVIHISNNISDNDTVDVRISYPNGETYIILSKKVIKGIFPDTVACYFWLDEEEILKMSAAIVDAGLYPGAILNVTKYIEPSIQEASVANYVPSLSILSLLESDPNIVERCSQELNKELRKALENRLAASMDLDVSEIQWDINPNRSFSRENLPQESNINKEYKEDLHSTDDSLDHVIEENVDHAIANQIDSEANSMENDFYIDVDGTTADSNENLGEASHYLYYSQEEEAKEREVELGQ
ncbi:MAG: hypothetical protein GX359_04455 [Clostridiales bacterium]|nr:hypothetical protein [Clostridiales bacterium]